MQRLNETAEQRRLEEAREQKVPWKKWGPYLSERQWGTVREDYSDNGDAWSYFSYDQACSRAYHWGEDGLAGFSDEKQRLCFALALWNGRDSMIKERLFGLTISVSNRASEPASIHVLPTLFLRNEKGQRPVYGDIEKFQTDIHWRDHLLFYEYFHGDNGVGLGAGHQTGWTGLVSKLIQLSHLDQKAALELGRAAAFPRRAKAGFSHFLAKSDVVGALSVE